MPKYKVLMHAIVEASSLEDAIRIGRQVLRYGTEETASTIPPKDLIRAMVESAVLQPKK